MPGWAWVWPLAFRAICTVNENRIGDVFHRYVFVDNASDPARIPNKYSAFVLRSQGGETYSP